MDALAKARKVLAARVSDPKARFIPGLSDDLRAVLEAFDEIDRRTALLAAFVLRGHFGISKHRAQLEGIAAMGQEASAVLRIADHGGKCCCMECMR